MRLACLLLIARACAPSGPQAQEIQRRPLAGTVVRSKDWKLVRLPVEYEEFAGDVEYLRAGRRVRADWARLERAKGLWEARGDIRAELRRKDGGVLSVFGQRARHDERARRGSLEGRHALDPVAFDLRAADGSLREAGTARRLAWDEGLGQARLQGEVHARGEDGESWSEDALYLDRERALVLTGRRPVLARDEAEWAGAVQAERIAADYDRRRVDADGRVTGWLAFKDHGTVGRKPR